MRDDGHMTYPGGKSGSGVYQRLINLIPPHSLYVEAFLGGGAVMRLKRPASSSIGIDSDADVVGDFCAVVPGLTLLNADALAWLASTVLSDDAFLYLDPPYLMHTRSCQRPLYRHEFSEEQHRTLLGIIKRLPCRVMISGYWSRMYADALRSWRTVTFQASTRGGRMATEWVWMNYPEPLELHDYRHLGGDYRERERIKRKQLRWRSRLQRMDGLERYALLNCIEDLRSLVSSEMAGTARVTPAKNGDADGEAVNIASFDDVHVDTIAYGGGAAPPESTGLAASIGGCGGSGRYRQKRRASRLAENGDGAPLSEMMVSPGCDSLSSVTARKVTG